MDNPRDVALAAYVTKEITTMQIIHLKTEKLKNQSPFANF